MEGKARNTDKSKRTPFYKFPIFGGMAFFLLISLILFYLLFIDRIPDKFLIPLFSIAISLFIFGLILLCGVFFYYSIGTTQFANDMRALSGEIDKIIRKIENPNIEENYGDKESLFKFKKLTVTFKFPFMQIETEAMRKDDSNPEKNE